MKKGLNKSERKQLVAFLLKTILTLAAIILLIVVSPYFAFIFLAIAVWMGIDLALGLTSKSRPTAPKKEDKHVYRYSFSDILWLFEHRGMRHPDIEFGMEDITEEMLLNIIEEDLKYIHERYDCYDFRAVRLYRLIMASDDVLDEISPRVRTLLDETFLSMKFWITEKGVDSACYFSENHSLTFFVLAYLIGRRYADKTFTLDGRLGSEKAEEARRRILMWLNLRGKYGFSEFYSHNYLPVNFAQLSLLLLYGDREDKELMERVRSVLDLLCLDYAHAYSFGTIIGAQGRAYARNNLNTAFHENNSEIVIESAFGDGSKVGGVYAHTGRQSELFLRLILARDEEGKPLYEVPAAIKAIAASRETEIIKTASGLDLSELEEQGLLGVSDRAITFQFGMEAFSNPEVLNNTLDIVNEYSLIRNHFFSSFKYFNISFLRFLGVLPFVSKALKIYPNGVAIQRANVYAYKTKHYKLSSLQRYYPGSAGAQQTTMAVVLPEAVTVFTNHPLKDKVFHTSPGFWGGYGCAPDAAQHENVCMLIHHIPKSIIFSPAPMVDDTHTYLPEELLDEVIVEGRYAFARKGETYLALIGASDFEYLPFNEAKAAPMEGLIKDESKHFELVQRGRDQFTIYELSSAEKEGDFSAFVERIKGNAVSYDGSTLAYASREKGLSLTYRGAFTVNGEAQESEYKRFETPYVQADYLAEDIQVSAGGHTLRLNVREGVREEDVTKES